MKTREQKISRPAVSRNFNDDLDKMYIDRRTKYPSITTAKKTLEAAGYRKVNGSRWKDEKGDMAFLTALMETTHYKQKQVKNGKGYEWVDVGPSKQEQVGALITWGELPLTTSDDILNLPLTQKYKNRR